MIRGQVVHLEPRRQVTARDESPRRFVPPLGRSLTLANVRGPWRPSGTVAGVGIFALVWETRSGPFWAALHDFAAPDQLRIVEACRRIDRDSGFLGAPPWWRS